MKSGSKRLKAIEGTVIFGVFCAVHNIPVRLVMKWILADVSFKSLPPKLQDALNVTETNALVELDVKAKFETLSEARKKKLAVAYQEYLATPLNENEDDEIQLANTPFMKLPLKKQLLSIHCHGWVTAKQMINV